MRFPQPGSWPPTGAVHRDAATTSDAVVRAGLAGRQTEPVTAADLTHTVHTRGSGPGVVLLPEIPGLTPQVLALADHLVGSGLTVAVVSLFGEDGRALSPATRPGPSPAPASAGSSPPSPAGRPAGRRARPRRRPLAARPGGRAGRGDLVVWTLVSAGAEEAVYPWFIWLAPSGAVLGVLYAVGIGRPRR